MKTIVAHFSPDIDSITSCWLVKRFMQGWEKADIKFVAAGQTLDGQKVDSNPDVIHVDTGFGRFDHHQTADYTSASLLVFNHLKKEKLLKDRVIFALEKMVTEVNNYDHFGEVYFPDPASDHYEFMLHKIIEGGLKSILREDIIITESVFPFLDALLNIFIKKVYAEEELKKGFVFTSKYGKSIIVETKNEETTKLALKNGYSFVAKRDPEKGSIRIKTLPEPKYDLKPLYDLILKFDKKEATWYLHKSGNMLLNASSKNPNSVPSTLSVNKLIEIVKSI